MALTHLRRKKSDRTGHKKSPAAAARQDEMAEVEEEEEEEKKAAEEHADGESADDADNEGDERKPASVESNNDCDDASEHEQADAEVATASKSANNANTTANTVEPDPELIARMAAAIQRAEERLEARTPSPVIYQGAPVALARSPTTLLPPTHPSYTGDITPSHPLYPYTNAVPPPEYICYLFPPSTRPHIYSPTNSGDGEEEGSDNTNTAADTIVVQPEARQARPHQFVNPRHLVPLPSHVEEYLDDSDLDDPLLRQFHALTIDLPDRPWNGGPVTRGFRDPREPRPTQEERQRNREERRRRYIENRMAQEEERHRLAVEEEERRRQEGGDNEGEGSSDDDDSESGENNEDGEDDSNDNDSNDNEGEVAELSEGINRLDVASKGDGDDETSGSNSNSSERSGRSSASSSIELTPELEALLFSQNPTGRMDLAIQSVLANYIPSDEGENNASADGDGDSEEEDDSELPQNLGDEMQPMAMNFGMLGAPISPPLGMGLHPGSFGQSVSPPLTPPMGMPPPPMPMGMMPSPPMGIMPPPPMGMPPPPMMADTDMMFGLGDLLGGGAGFGMGLQTAGGGPRRRLSNSSTDSEDMYLNTSSREPPTERIRYRNRRKRAARAARTAGGGRGGDDDSDDSDGSQNSVGKGSGGGTGGAPFLPSVPNRHKRKGKLPVTGPDADPIPDYALPAELHTKAVRRLLYVSNDIRIDWGNILHRILEHPEEASEYTGHQAPTLLLCFERRAPLPVIEALVYNDKKVPYHQDGSGDTALHYFCGGYDIPAQPKKCRDHFPRYAKYICDENPKLALLPNCAGVLPVHTCNNFECSSILVKAAPEGIMFRSIFDGWTALHSRCDYFVNSNDDALLMHGGEDLFLNRDESPPIVRMLVEEGLNLTWDVLSDARVHNSPAVRVPGYHRLALGGVMVKDKSNRSPFHRICRGINNKLTDDGRPKENYYDKVLHMLWAKLRTFAEASYVASVYETSRRKQMQRFVENGGSEEEARQLPHKRMSLESVGMGPDDPPYILLHELLRLRVPAKIVMQAMRCNEEEVKAIGRYGRKALHLAAEAGYNYDVFKVMVDIDPEVVDQPDPLTGLLPFMLASVSKTKFIETDDKNKDNERLTSVFQLLVDSPQSLLGQSDSKKT